MKSLFKKKRRFCAMKLKFFEMKIESLDNNFFQVALKYKRIGYCIKKLGGIRNNGSSSSSFL